MGWEKRGAGTYYYQKRRIGISVVSEYIGAGSFAVLIAQKDTIERAHTIMRRMKLRQLIEADLIIERELDKIGDLAKVLTYSVLLSSGFHTHKGQWRKKRDVN